VTNRTLLHELRTWKIACVISLLFCYSIITTFWNKFDHRVSVNGEITHVIFHKWRNNTCAPPYPVLYVRRNNTCEHSCPEKIAHASLHIRRDITHAIFHVLNSCSKVLRTRMLTCLISPNIENRIWMRTCIISPLMENHMCYFTIHGDSMIKFIPKCSYN
jgi:hypothetical protein